MKDDKIVVEEIWVPCEKGEEGHAITKDGKHYKIVARIANNVPLWLDDGVMLENTPRTKQEVEYEQKRFSI